MIVIIFLHSKESLCFLHWILHSFLCLKPLALLCGYYSLELENIHFIFMCRFWFVLDLEYMSDPCCFESFFAWGDFCFLPHVDFFQCLVGKVGSSFPYLFQREVLVFSLFCFIHKFVGQFSSCFVHDCLKF